MEPWQTLSKSIIFARKPFVEVSQQTVKLPDGTEIDDFYQVHLRSFATVVPVSDESKVLVLRHYKHGPGRVCLGMPAGFVDPGESPLEGAKRELREETGLESDDWTTLGTYVDNGNQRGCEGHYFLARGCVQRHVPNSGDLEDMEMIWMTIDEVDQALRENAFGVVHQAANWAFARPYL